VIHLKEISIENLKEYILENDLLESLLVELGFEPKEHEKHFAFANLDGDNPSAITLYKDTLKVINWTRDYKGDIITLIEESLEVSFIEALNILVDFTKYETCNHVSQESCLKILREIEKSSEIIKDDVEQKILPEDILDDYIKKPNQIWYDEGIEVETQAEFEICYCKKSDCIIIPIRNHDGKLVGIKNRKNTNEEVYMKYFYSYSIKKNHLLYGLYKTKPYIEENKQVIVVESEKSVMKLWQNGIKNTVAIMGTLSYNQILLLEKLNVDIILAYDKDKSWELMNKEKEKFVIKPQYIYDDDDLLKGKESPIDKGIETFLKIFENRY
jgi:DNA primase